MRAGLASHTRRAVRLGAIIWHGNSWKAGSPAKPIEMFACRIKSRDGEDWEIVFRSTLL